MRVIHTACGDDRIGMCTLVPRTQEVTDWEINEDGTFSPSDYDGRDDAFWDGEIPDPDGAYWCYGCDQQFDLDELSLAEDNNNHNGN